jgi:hypothetical protein
MSKTTQWLFAIILGVIGVLVSAGIFVYVAYATERIFGLVAVACGFISGGAASLGFMLGGGSFRIKSDVDAYLWMSTIFGLLGVLSAYFLPYLILFSAMPMATYLNLISFGILDVVFIAIGAYGGKWAGQNIGKLILIKNHPEAKG